jgi:hypothetical protein
MKSSHRVVCRLADAAHSIGWPSGQERRVRIAQVSLLTDTVVPWPSNNAGRAAAYLIEELVGEHEVTLFAREQWKTSAELVQLRRIERHESLAQFHRRMVRSALRGEQRFDILHLHCDRPCLPAVGQMEVPCVVTLHAPCAIPDRIAAWDAAVVPTSWCQQVTDAAANLRPPISHGVPGGLHSFQEAAGDYLTYNGPIAHDSGINDAVGLAARSGLELRVVSDVAMADRGYFNEVFVPMLHANRRVQWTVGLDDRTRNALLGGARALLASSDRSGAFEMQIIEALACGTPVIAWADTAAASILEGGASGFVVHNGEEALAAIAKIATLDRHACRRSFEERFEMRLIAGQYSQLYARLLHAHEASVVTVESCRRTSAPQRR